MRIYMDTCCYNRPFDDQTHDRIRLEADAILSVIQMALSGELDLVGSTVLDYELENISDPIKKQRTKELYNVANFYIKMNDDVKARAAQIGSMSEIKAYDSLQVASAELSQADVMLTTDDKLEKMMANLEIKVRVMNPLAFFLEYIKGGNEK